MTGNNWQTPDYVLDVVREFSPIVLDPCTTRDNPTRAEHIRTPGCDPDGLATNWQEFGGLVFVNPPYGRGVVQLWADKILEEARRGCQVIALMRGDTSPAWARRMLVQACGLCFPPRIKFRGATGSPNFANIVYYFGVEGAIFDRVFHQLGPTR